MSQGSIADSMTVPISSLQLWDKNPRSIKDDRFNELKARLKRQGQVKPLLVAADGKTVIGGNMRLRAMQALGIEEVWISQTGAKTDKDIFDLALTDNEEFGYYEKEQLAELALALELTPLELQSYELNLGKTTTLDLVLDEFQPTPEEDEVPEVDDVNEPESVLGEVYQLGSHRLMCGSATEQGDVALLMDGAKADMVFTDPPYGMNLDTDYAKRPLTQAASDKHKGQNSYSPVIGDDVDYDPQHIFNDFGYCKEIFLWGADYYSKRLPDGGSWIVWDKKKGIEDVEYTSAEFEICWSRNKTAKKIVRVTWFGLLGTEKQDVRNRIHPTQKPLELNEWFIRKYSECDDLIVDVFGGSGSTLIACEQTNRICYMMELDPKYCDVIRKRYAKHIGEEESWLEVTPSVNVPVLV